MIDPPRPNSRLYVALYIRDGLPPGLHPKDDRYHWALLAISSNSNQATRFHARDFFSSPEQTRWFYEEIHVDARGTPKLLAKTLLGDIHGMERLFEALRDVPLVQQTAGWNCISWIRGALDAIEEDGEVLSGDSYIRDWVELKMLVLDAADAEKARRDSLVKVLL